MSMTDYGAGSPDNSGQSNEGVSQKNIALTHNCQQSAYRDARDAVADDVDEGAIDADEWGGEPTDGEVVRVLAMAYLGKLDYGEGAD